MCRRLWTLSLLAAVAGCRSVDEETELNYSLMMDYGRTHYNGHKFLEAVRAYSRACELKPLEYDAWIALGNAASELSLTLYAEADNLFSVRKTDLARRTLGDADEHHKLANKAFGKATELRRDEPQTDYYVALMLCKRATTPYNFPYPASREVPERLKGDRELVEKWNQGVEQRCVERDKAIELFEKVIRREKVALDAPDHAAKCGNAQAHRYVGILYIARNDWERFDCERMRQHLALYVTWVAGYRDHIVKTMTARTDEEKAKKQRDLEFLEEDLTKTRELLRSWLHELTETEALLRLGKPAPGVPEDKREARRQALSREILILRGVVEAFDKARRKSS